MENHILASPSPSLIIYAFVSITRFRVQLLLTQIKQHRHRKLPIAE
jgi:hypothetical protein